MYTEFHVHVNFKWVGRCAQTCKEIKGVVVEMVIHMTNMKTYKFCNVESLQKFRQKFNFIKTFCERVKIFFYSVWFGHPGATFIIQMYKQIFLLKSIIIYIVHNTLQTLSFILVFGIVEKKIERT